MKPTTKLGHLVIKTAVATALVLFSSFSSADDRTYTCSDLIRDSKDKTVNGKKNDLWTLNEYLEFYKNSTYKHFAKTVAEKIYESSKAEGIKNAYSFSLDAYEEQMDTIELANLALKKVSSSDGDLSRYLLKTCSDLKRDNQPIESVFFSYIKIAQDLKSKQ